MQTDMISSEGHENGFTENVPKKRLRTKIVGLAVIVLTAIIITILVARNMNAYDYDEALKKSTKMAVAQSEAYRKQLADEHEDEMQEKLKERREQLKVLNSANSSEADIEIIRRQLVSDVLISEEQAMTMNRKELADLTEKYLILQEDLIKQGEEWNEYVKGKVEDETKLAQKSIHKALRNLAKEAVQNNAGNTQLDFFGRKKGWQDIHLEDTDTEEADTIIAYYNSLLDSLAEVHSDKAEKLRDKYLTNGITMKRLANLEIKIFETEGFDIDSAIEDATYITNLTSSE